ncbi:MAG: hypothetical protein AB1564_01600 [Chloroflexota bacterium]
MAHSLILHISNEEAVLGEVEELPKSTDTLVTISNPRRRDGKDLHYIEANVTTVIFPMSRISFIEIVSGAEDEHIIGFVRE